MTTPRTSGWHASAPRADPRRSARGALLALLCLALVAACTPASDGDGHVVPTALLDDLEGLKTEDGLFARPSAFSLGDVSVYTTALVDELSPDAPARSLAVSTLDPAEQETVSARWYAWAFVRASQGTARRP